jgi:hypothetical protein
VLILTRDRCTVCAKRTIGSEIVLNAPDGSPRRVGHVESRFDPFGDSVSISAIRCTVLRRMYHWLRKSFWMHPMILLGDEAQVEACLSPFGDSANLDAG